MRFTLVALLALANSLSSGVQGYPAAEETSSLVVPQVTQSFDIPSLIGDVEKILKDLVDSLTGVAGNLRRALPSTPDLASSVPPSRLSPTATSLRPTVATSASTLPGSHSPSVSGVSKASSSHSNRMRRQASSSLSSSVLSSAFSKLGSATSKLGSSPPTSSHPNAGPTGV